VLERELLSRQHGGDEMLLIENTFGTQRIGTDWAQLHDLGTASGQRASFGNIAPGRPIAEIDDRSGRAVSIGAAVPGVGPRAARG
jgi:hypothetical protein